MHTETVTYEADGLTMQSLLFVPGSDAPAPGILVFPEAFGLGEHAIARAQRLASSGFVALACDLHGDGRLVETLEEAMPIAAALRADLLRLRARARAGLGMLAARPEVDAERIAAIGFCFGGTMALELARSGAPIAGVVGFHCRIGTQRPQDATNIRARILICNGADDPAAPAEDRAAFEAEMRSAGVDWQMHLYGGVLHSFTNAEADTLGRPDFARYDANADRRSWQSMLNFFDEIFA